MTLGYYVLHEGLIGVLGDQGLQEYTYDKLDKEEPISGQNTRRQGLGQRHRRLRRHHRQVLGRGRHPRPDSALSGLASRRSQGQPAKAYQANVLGARADAQPGATAEMTQRLFAGAKEVAVVDGYSESLRHQELRSADRLGLVLLHHQAAL